MKVTSDPVKSTLPGCKRWLRAVDANGQFVMDVLDLKEGPGQPFAPTQVAFDPSNPQRHKTIPAACRLDDCRSVVMDHGEILQASPTLGEIADYCAGQLKKLPDGSLRLINPHVYKVGVSGRLLDLRGTLAQTQSIP